MLHNQQVTLTLADTREEQIKGLQGAEKLPDNKGMLFVFPVEGKYGVWTKDMKISIDVIWVNANKEVVEIRENFVPCHNNLECETATSTKPAKYIIEVNSGWTKRFGLEVGDKLSEL